MRGVADTQAAQQASQQGKKKVEQAMDELKGHGKASGDVDAGADGSMTSTQMAHGAVKDVKNAGGASQGGKKMRMNQFGKMVPEDQLFAEDGGRTGLEAEGEVFGKGDPHEGKSM